LKSASKTSLIRKEVLLQEVIQEVAWRVPRWNGGNGGFPGMGGMGGMPGGMGGGASKRMIRLGICLMKRIWSR